MLGASFRAEPGRRKEVSSLLWCDVRTHAELSISRRLGHIKRGSAGRTGSDENRWQHMNALGSRYDRRRSCSDCVSTILTPGRHHEITCHLRPSVATWYAKSSQEFGRRHVPFRAGWHGSPKPVRSLRRHAGSGLCKLARVLSTEPHRHQVKELDP